MSPLSRPQLIGWALLIALYVLIQRPMIGWIGRWIPTSKLDQLAQVQGELALLQTRYHQLEAQMNALHSSGASPPPVPSPWQEATLAHIVAQRTTLLTSEIWVYSHNVAIGSVVTWGDKLVGIVDRVSGPLGRVKTLFDPACIVSAYAWREDRPGNALANHLSEWAGDPQLLSSVPQVCKQLDELARLAAGAHRVPHGRGLMVGRVPSLPGHPLLLKGEDFNKLTLDPKSSASPVAAGDVLITSGIDGRFPPGLKVGRVQHVIPRDGAGLIYNVEAASDLPPLELLRVVCLIPPLAPLP